MSEKAKNRRKETWKNKTNKELKEHSERLSKALKGRPKPENSGLQKGHKKSEEWKNNLSKSHKGKELSEEHKNKTNSGC